MTTPAPGLAAEVENIRAESYTGTIANGEKVYAPLRTDETAAVFAYIDQQAREVADLRDRITALENKCALLAASERQAEQECAGLRKKLANLISHEAANRNAIATHLTTIAAAEARERELTQQLQAALDTNRRNCDEAEGRIAELHRQYAQQGERLEAAEARERGLREALQSILDTACSVPAPYIGNAMDPINDLRIVSGRKIDAARAALAAQPAAVELDADDRAALKLCSDCPPVGYPTDKTRCRTCPLRAQPAAAGREGQS